MLKLKSIKTKYLFAGVLISFISIVIVSIITYTVAFNITSDLTDKRIKEVTERKAIEFDHWFKQKELIIETCAQDIVASDNFSNEHITKLLKNKITIYSKEISDFYIGFEDESRGVISGVGWNPPIGYSAKSRPWYQDAVKSKSAILTEPYVDAMSGNLIVSVAKALIKNDKVIGVICTDIFITELIRVANSFNIGDGSYALLLNERGEIIAHPYRPFLPSEKGFMTPDSSQWPDYKILVNKLLTGNLNEKIDITDHSGIKTYFIFSTINKNKWSFGIAISQTEYQKPLRLLYIGFGFAFLISIVLGIAIMYRMINSMIKPVQSLTNAVSSFSENNLDVRATVFSDDEIGTLAYAFNNMADTICGYSRNLESKVELRTSQLKEKNDNIMQSINYARRLQNAVIPNLQQKLGIDINKYFSIWRPRDTVGGDMYWCRMDGSTKLLVVADCTGHGVPGALMTMTISSILDSTARETGLESPSKMLDLVNQRLKQNLMDNNDDSVIRDGADIAMLMFDSINKKMIFVGAGLSMFTENNGIVQEYKGGKYGIGHSSGKIINPVEIIIPYKNNTKYYFTTDGFLDQNNIPHKSGIGKQGFIKLLENISTMNMNDQKQFFEKEINTKLKFVPQRDDITIIGLEI